MRPPPRKLFLVVLVLTLASAARGDFTEFEDQPFLTPGGAEVNPLSDAAPVPFDGTDFLTAFPDGVKLVRGNLDVSDIDAYEVVAMSGELLLAALFDDASEAFVDLVIGVFSGGAGPALALDDDSGLGLLGQLGLGVSATGALQVAVSGFGDTAFDGTHEESRQGLSSYRLVLGVTDGASTQQESDLDPGPQGSNDTLATADPLPANGALVRANLAANDVDYFAIDLEASDRLLATVFDLQNTGLAVAGGERNDPVLGLFDPSGTPVPGGTDDDDTPGFTPGFSYTAPLSGTYTLAVSGFSDTAFDGTHLEGGFDYLLMVARDRACPNVVDLISAVVNSTPSSYEDDAELEGGDHYYTDRTNEQSHVLVDVPEEVECLEWIKTSNSSADKDATVFPHLTFVVAQDASVYIGYDTRATSEPAWLATGFTPTQRVIDIADPDPTQEFDLLRRDFPAGTVELGGNDRPGTGAGSNYVVFAGPIDTSNPDQAAEVPAPVPNGTASATVDGVTVQVETSEGQSADEVADALAAAINADPTLQAMRIFAIGTGGFLVTTGMLDDLVLTPTPGVPSGSLLTLALLCLLVAGAALAGLRRA